MHSKIILVSLLVSIFTSCNSTDDETQTDENKNNSQNMPKNNHPIDYNDDISVHLKAVESQLKFYKELFKDSSEITQFHIESRDKILSTRDSLLELMN